MFRSDGLHALTVEDAALLGRLGLRVVYDLRMDAERDKQPSVPLPEVRAVGLPIGGPAGQTQSIVGGVVSGEVQGMDPDFLAGVYREMMELNAGTFAVLLTGLTDPGGLPAVFHCTAGKDRTGMTAALLLSVLGVPDEVVLDDYELSTALWSEERIREMAPRFEAAGKDIEQFKALFTAPREVMGGALAELRERHGTAEHLLVDVGGMDPEVPGELRAALVVPDAGERDDPASPASPAAVRGTADP